jgi:hypothetical protein
MAELQKNLPYKGVNVDIDETLMQPDTSPFIKDVVIDVNNNPTADIANGANSLVATPLIANAIYENLPTPEGVNKEIGYHSFRVLNQGFCFRWNDQGNHNIYRINSDHSADLVGMGPWFNFQYDPKHFIGAGRCTAQQSTRVNPVTGVMEDITYLIFTDNYNDIGFVCVEDAVATGGFDPARFPYFQTSDPNCNRANYFKLGLTPPTDCIRITEIPRDADDPEELQKPDLISRKAIQFRLRFIDVWGRPSEYGVISEQYISALGGSCLSNSLGLARCLKLVFNVGCPLIDKIELLVRYWDGNIRGLSTETDWYLYDTIEKYNNCDKKNWWERSFRNDIGYDSAANTMEYTFCGNKALIPVDVTQTNRLENPLALTASTVFPVNKSIGMARLTKKFQPLDCSQLDKLKFTVTPPGAPTPCDTTKLVKIKVYGLLYNPFEEQAVPLRKHDSSIVFGAADCYGSRDNNPFVYNQVLPKDQEGIIGYLAGTKNWCISKQYLYSTADGSLTLQGINYNPPSSTRPGPDGQPGRYYPLQVWEFDVEPGVYVMRVSSHTATPSDTYEKTSTRLIGTTTKDNMGQLVAETKELRIDATNGDVDLLQNPLMIYDLTRVGKGCLVVDRTSVNEGYLYEDEISKIPVEMAAIRENIGAPTRPQYTDHNGYYFCATRHSGLAVRLYGYKNCQPNQELAIASKTYDSADTLYRMDTLYVYRDQVPYPEKDRFLIKGRMVLCDNQNAGIPGALVVLSRGAYAYTDSKGEFTIAAHNVGDTSNPRIDSLIYSQRGICKLVSCETGCTPSIPDQQVVSPACSGGQRTVTVPSVSMRIQGLNRKGPQMGGRYQGGIIMHDWMDRKSFVQTDDTKFIDIPPIYQTKNFNYSSVSFDITGMVFPANVKWVSFAFTRNLNFSDFMSWAIDRVQFVDNTGNTNNVNPTAIRLYYEGLAEYNKQNQFSTNTAWEFLKDDQVILGDRVEFIANGDGTIYDKLIQAEVQYDKEGKYVQIEYNDDLRTLTAGALIRLIRPTLSADQQFFYELCPMIRVVNGIPQVTQGTLNLVDSYLLSRQIPVPVEVPVTTTDANGNEVITSQTENQLHSYPFPFEHHSPADTWGDHAWNKGRVNTTNPEEKLQFIGTQIDVSQTLSMTGSYNGLGFIDTSLSVEFDKQEWGDITVCFSEVGNILVICEHDNFTVAFSDNRLVMNSGGQIIANPNLFGRPDRKVGNNYGCQMKDYNTIQRKDGTTAYVFFLDSSKGALVRHDYTKAVDMSVSGFKSWLISKIKYVSSQPGHYWHAGIDPKRGEYLLSNTRLYQQEQDYVNQNANISIPSFETAAFHMDAGALMRWYSFVPEYFGYIEGDGQDQQLISFKNGVAWYHYDVLTPATQFNRFFGVQTVPYMEMVFNTGSRELKRFRNSEIYIRGAQLYADRVITSAGQQSRIMPLFWKYLNKFYAAEFLCATNTVPDTQMPLQTGEHALMDGDLLYGQWVKVRYRPKTTDLNKYFELKEIVCYFDSLEKSAP